LAEKGIIQYIFTIHFIDITISHHAFKAAECRAGGLRFIYCDIFRCDIIRKDKD